MTFPSYGFYISHLVRFPRICNNVLDINDRNLIITEKLLHQGYHFHKLLKTFTKLYYRYTDLVYTYNSTCRNMIKKDIYHQCSYGAVINNSEKVKSKTLKKSYSYGL